MNEPSECERHCECTETSHATQLIVVTGGPGAGKTAVLEIVKKVLCEHVAILPEAASIIFGGGFWRMPSETARKSAQSAIYHVQCEMERLVIGEKKWATGLCDRGTLDGLAYWPGNESAFWEMNRSTQTSEYDKYAAVIHLQSPSDQFGYNHQNPLRVESASEANKIDDKIASVWSKHPNYERIESSKSFMDKAQSAIELISKHMPQCCRSGLKGAISAQR